MSYCMQLNPDITKYTVHVTERGNCQSCNDRVGDCLKLTTLPESSIREALISMHAD